MRQILDGKTPLLSLEGFKKALDSWNFKHVALHGWGEPLLNPQLFEMIEYAQSKGVSTELTTNATLLEKNIDRIFASGLGIIGFGIHQKENLPVVMPQIKDLIAQRNKKKLRRPRTYIDIVIYKGNLYQIRDLIEAAAELDIDAIVLHRVYTLRHSNGDTKYISIPEEKELFLKVRKLARNLNVKLYLPPPPSIPCRAVKYSIFVTSKGKVSPCPYLADFNLGDELNGCVRKAVDSQPYRSFVKNMKEHPACGKCPLGSTSGGFYT